jgi:hypothetical protein
MLVINTAVKLGFTTASFCRQVATWFPDMSYNFYVGINYQIATNTAATEAREK